MSPEEMLSKVLESTRTGSLRWSEVGNQPVYFEASLGNGKLRVWCHNGEWPHEQTVFIVEFWNGQGLLASKLEKLIPDSNREENEYKELYDLARASARNLDTLLDSMLSDLQ